MITDDGLKLIKHFEGCKLLAYRDSAGIWTIGWGHTRNVKQGDTCSQEQADQWLLEDLEEAEKRVDSLVTISFTPCERDSLISSAFNLRSFPKLAEYLNQDYVLFLTKLVLYCHDVQGHELLGLKRRRYAEKWRFEGLTWLEIEPKLLEITL
jgi:lysozyme